MTAGFGGKRCEQMDREYRQAPGPEEFSRHTQDIEIWHGRATPQLDDYENVWA